MTTTLYINIIGVGTVTTIDKNGSFVGIAYSRDYAAAGIATVTANPAEGWKFGHWIIDDIEGEQIPTISVNMDFSHTVLALFSQSEVAPPNPSILGYIVLAGAIVAASIATVISVFRKK